MQRTQTQRTVELLEEERKRLARDIHDGPAQSLTNVTMRLEIVQRLVENAQTAAAGKELERVQTLLRSTINDMRRMVFDLRPTLLENGITEAIQRYSQRFAQNTGLQVDVTVSWEVPDLGRTTEVAVFRVCQEALNNTYRHAGATVVSIDLSENDAVYRITIRDNGRGFESNHQSVSRFGLQGMNERMELVGGTMTVASEFGEGTTVVCELSKKRKED
jgi:signal transduction histidine kinase